MNLKLIFLLLFYWVIISAFFVTAGSVFTDENGYEFNNTLNATEISDDEQDTGGLFGSGISLGRLIMFVTIGIGLPEDTPLFFKIPFILWHSILTILAIFLFIDAIWSG